MLFTSLEMAQRLEEVDSIHAARNAHACAQLFPDHKPFTVPIGNGVASITVPSFGRKLNRIVGYGMAGAVSEDELVKIENIFTERGVGTHIGLCPHADPSVLPLLASHGYSMDAFLNSYVRVLTDEDLKEKEVEGVVISRLSEEKAFEFPAWSVAGYRDGGRAELLLDTVARVAALRQDTSLYIALIDGKVAGSACMALIELEKGAVAHLHLDSTLTEFRGRGIQAALLRARLVGARKAGFDLASIAARPDNRGSCRNIERVGFSLAYTKIWCGKLV